MKSIQAITREIPYKILQYKIIKLLTNLAY